MKRIKGLLRKYFITGLIVITPIWATYLILRGLLNTMEGFLGEIIRSHFPSYVPGIGIITLIILILITGILTTNIIGKKVLSVWDKFLNQVPIIRNIYTTIKSIVDTLSLQSRDNFSKVVLVEFPRKGLYSMGFVTGITEGEVQHKINKRIVNIYIPTTPNPTSGFLIFLPEDEVTPLSMSVEDGMKMIISIGMFTPHNIK